MLISNLILSQQKAGCVYNYLQIKGFTNLSFSQLKDALTIVVNAKEKSECEINNCLNSNAAKDFVTEFLFANRTLIDDTAYSDGGLNELINKITAEYKNLKLAFNFAVVLKSAFEFKDLRKAKSYVNTLRKKHIVDISEIDLQNLLLEAKFLATVEGISIKNKNNWFSSATTFKKDLKKRR